MNKLNIPEKLGVIGIDELTIKSLTVNTDLLSSINLNGIKYPIIIKDNGEIVTGKKRAFVAKQLRLDSINVRIVPSDLESEEYDLLAILDNLGNSNLYWADKAKLHNSYHSISKSIHRKQTLKDSAYFLDCSIALLSENITIAQALELEPAVANIQDRATALKYILTLNRRKNQGEVTPASNNVLHGNVRDTLDLFGDKEFDVCIIDGELSNSNPIFRVMKNDSFMFIIEDSFNWTLVKDYGFKPQRLPLIWIREDLPEGENTWEFSKNYTFVISAVKGHPSLTNNKVNPIIYGSKKTLIKYLLEHSSYEGSNILNPFAKDSSILESCIDMNRNYTVISEDKVVIDDIRSRLK